MHLPLRGTVSLAPYRGAPLLKRAIGVQHFSQVMKISDPSGAGIANFQEHIRSKFPEAMLETEKLFQFSMEDDKVSHIEIDLPVWRFFDKRRQWRASLTRETISIETKGDGYVDRYHFIEQMKFLVEAVGHFFAPAEAGRCGSRFVNVSPADGADALARCAPELVSITGSELVEQASLMWRFQVDEGTLLLRSGIAPPHTSHDPEMLEPVDTRSWFLDIDVFKADSVDFEPDKLIAAFGSQVQRAHAVFRWALPD